MIGVDLGGTKIEAVALDGAGADIFRERVPTPRHDYAATIAAIAGLAKRAGGKAPLPGVGVAIPGSVSKRTGLVKNANSTWLNGQPLARDLETAMGCKVQLANDANCFVLSEATDGAGAGQSVVFGVIAGTGIGLIGDDHLMHQCLVVVASEQRIRRAMGRCRLSLFIYECEFHLFSLLSCR